LKLLQIEEEEEEASRRHSDSFIKTEAASPDSRMKEESEDNGDEAETEADQVAALKAKLKQLEGSNKCSKCEVRLSYFLCLNKRSHLLCDLAKHLN
jgi:hypothetical protein